MCTRETVFISNCIDDGRNNITHLAEFQYYISPEKLGHSVPRTRSLKVVESDMDRLATYDFLLVIHSNHGLFPYRFQDIRDFIRKR